LLWSGIKAILFEGEFRLRRRDHRGRVFRRGNRAHAETQTPEAPVLIIEKTTAFDRKVGESTTEVSSCYMTRILGLTHYLGHHQLPKQGLRLWFSNRPDQPFDDCVEIGTRYQSRLPGFQVDRAKLDSHILELACRSGCDLWRPAKVTNFELNDGNGHTVNAVVDGGERTATCRWIVDATGRAAMFARKLGHFRPNTEHPINAVWARYGANVSPITRTVVELDASGPRTIFSGAAGGFGSSRCRAAMSAPVSFTTVASSNFQRDRVWDNDCTRTF